ncbi:MAG TPA: malto-oligosyltrehalose synthase, partial [Chitinophagaceae bacterium]|nr:malto-oligosyltrehalose synthase [Chitinophagaceae bacterium]
MLQQIPQIKQIEDQQAYSKSWDEFLLQLSSLMKNEATKSHVNACIESINSNPQQLEALADDQAYRLCHWQETDHHINYRRFFTVNSLICLNIQDEQVFEHFHQYIKALVDDGFFQGLRIDHIDGLYDPTQYLERLRTLVGDEQYVVVEKILQTNEVLPDQWLVQGNTGYDTLSILNNLFTNKSNAEVFTQFYEDLTGEQASVHEQLLQKKAYILYEHMAGELENLHSLFMELNLVDKKAFASVHREDLKNAIGEFLVRCPVYRFYGNKFPLSATDENAVQQVLNEIRRNRQKLSRAVQLLEEALIVKPKERNAERNQRALRFYQRCMQFTGPLMAKGVEDTLMYTYNRFIGHNEVGDHPEDFGITPEEFHQKMIHRQERWPLSMNATATHDTKRGEDVRARLNVLTDIDGQWTQAVQQWHQLNRHLKKDGAPGDNDEYFIYQTLAGAYPMPGEDDDRFAERMKEYLQKSLREAKVNSNWTEPNTAYEEATVAFAQALLDTSTPFWKTFSEFHRTIADFGIVNSLAQLLLKFTCPGTPDVYQGCELWDFSLVDPDNRRPVDYKKRQQWLQELKEGEGEELLQHLWENRYTAKIKLWLTHQLFHLRKQHTAEFTQGQHIPLQTEGRYKNNVMAFARK